MPTLPSHNSELMAQTLEKKRGAGKPKRGGERIFHCHRGATGNGRTPAAQRGGSQDAHESLGWLGIYRLALLIPGRLAQFRQTRSRDRLAVTFVHFIRNMEFHIGRKIHYTAHVVRRARLWNTLSSAR